MGQGEKAARLLELHHQRAPLLLVNAWDAGSARLLESLGFDAIATTSSGHAATLGRLDGQVTREEALAHSADLVAATQLPVSADLENGFGAEPEAVAETIRGALEAGLAGASIEDSTGQSGAAIYDRDLAVARVEAAAEAAHAGPVRLVLTARCENYLHGRPDLPDTVARLQAYGAAGADCVYAPGLTRLEDIRTLVAAVEQPVNVLALPHAPTVPELGEAGVKRISVGGAFAFAALGAAVAAAKELRDKGTYGFWSVAGEGSRAAKDAFAANQ
jgi:2-methylisocitrate lyase-like PEP mutase family enzyme